MEFLNDDIEIIDKECATIRYMNVFKRNLLAVSEQPLLEQLLLQELTDHWQATTDDSNGSALLNSSSNVNDDKKQNCCVKSKFDCHLLNIAFLIVCFLK